MATIIGSTSSSLWSFKLEVVENSTSVANNSSKVTVTAYLGRPASAGGSYLYGANISCSVSVTGVSAKTITYNNSDQVNIAAGGWLSLGSVVFDNVPHDANGSKTVTVSANFTSDISPASGSASGSVKLTDIARASTFTIDKTKVYANGKDAITVTINSKNTAYRHTITVAMGGLNQTFSVAAGVSKYAFTVPYDWLNGIPAQESSDVTDIVLTTYNGTTLVGSNNSPKCFTVWCPDDVVPVISSVTLTGNNLRDGVYVQGKSTATIKTVAGGVYGSKIISCYCMVDGVQYTGTEFTTAAFKSHGAYNLTVTVTDGRGRSASKPVTAFTVYEYKPPYITSFTAERQSDGTTVIAKLVGGVSSLNNKNTKSFTVNLNGKTLSVSSSDYTVNGSVTFTGVDTDKTFVATARVADYYGDSAAVTKPVVVSTESVTMDFHYSGKGVAFGKVSEEERLLDVEWALKSPSVDNLLGGYGLDIPANSDLNAPDYVNVGNYVCSWNTTAATLVNSPTTNAFKMIVSNVLGKDLKPVAGGYLYIVREITDIYGYRYSQFVHCNGASDWTFGTWNVELDTAHIRDYIIERGTSGMWTYRKWYSGLAECWGAYTHNVTAWSTWGSMYYADPLSARVDYPFAFKDRPIENVSLKGGSLAGWLYVEGGGYSLNTSTQTAQYGICRPTISTQTASFTLDFNIIGKWK